MGWPVFGLPPWKKFSAARSRSSRSAQEDGCSSLPCRGVLSFRSEAREASGSEAAQVHIACRRCGGCMATRGRRAAMARGSTGNAMKGITEWLASIGLSEYAQRFANNAIDLSVIRDLTEQDLKDLGVLLGHRRRILRAIAELDGGAPSPTETAIEPALRDGAQRRHLTLMICDLVGSTALSARRNTRLFRLSPRA